MSELEFSMELIYDLHKVMGIDAVTECYESLETDEEREEFLRVLKEYYDTKYWEKIENGCGI